MRWRLLAVAVGLIVAAAAPAYGAGGYVDVIVKARTSTAGLAVFPASRQARAGAIEDALRYRLGQRAGLLHVLRRARADGSVLRMRRLWIIGGYAIRATPAEVARLRARPDVVSVTADASDVRPATVASNLVAMHFPDVWAHAGTGTLAGTTGTGVTIALLDGPVSPTDLPGFRGGAHDLFDPYNHVPTNSNCADHATEVGSVMLVGDAGNGVEIGGAPGASWIAGRAFSADCTGAPSGIHEDFQWVLDPDGDPSTPDGADVVNNSWDQDDAISCDRTYEPDLQALVAARIVPVFAAGNDLHGLAPATLPEALAVGALDTDFTTPWSGSAPGPSPCGDRTRPFPDVAAPGVQIPVRAPGGHISTDTGTSLAAPQVTAILALLLARHPGMTADQQIAAITSTANSAVGAPGVDDQTGAGIPDALAAFESTLPDPRDLTPPRISGASAMPQLAAAGNVVITAHASDAAPGARVTGTIAAASAVVDAGAPIAMNAGDGTFDGSEENLTTSLPVASLSEGVHSVVIAATDAAGNTGPGGTVTFTVDTTRPTITSPVLTTTDGVATLAVSAADGGSGVDAGEWFIDADRGAGTGIALTFRSGTRDDAHAVLAGTIDTGALASGDHSIGARVRDRAGNWSTVRLVVLRVPARVLLDGFEHGLGQWSSRHGNAGTSRAAAIQGRRGLDVQLRGGRSGFLTKTAVGNVASLAAHFRVDVRHAVLPGPVALFDGRSRGGRSTVVVQVHHPRGFQPTVRLCITAGAMHCTAWAPMHGRAPEVAFRWSRAGATLIVDGAGLGSIPGPLPGRVDAIRLGAVGPARGSHGALHLDALSAVRGA